MAKSCDKTLQIDFTADQDTMILHPCDAVTAFDRMRWHDWAKRNNYQSYKIKLWARVWVCKTHKCFLTSPSDPWDCYKCPQADWDEDGDCSCRFPKDLERGDLRTCWNVVLVDKKLALSHLQVQALLNLHRNLAPQAKLKGMQQHLNKIKFKSLESLGTRYYTESKMAIGNGVKDSCQRILLFKPTDNL